MADPSSPFTVPPDVRNMAENTLLQARAAVERYMQETQKIYAAAERSAEATKEGTREMTQKTVSFAQANVAAAFDYAQKLVHAKDLQEIAAIQRSFLEGQAEQVKAQMAEFSSAAAGAMEALKPKF